MTAAEIHQRMPDNKMPCYRCPNDATHEVFGYRSVGRQSDKPEWIAVCDRHNIFADWNKRREESQ